MSGPTLILWPASGQLMPLSGSSTGPGLRHIFAAAAVDTTAMVGYLT